MAEEPEVVSLYVRGMIKPPEEIEDVWDDTVLNNAYDKALKMANEEVAKRIAMETNSSHSKNSKMKCSVKDKPKSTKETTKPATSKTSTEWKGGMPCRAVYEEDGVEYEAFLVKIINEEDCIVKFLGYDNTERVPISSLKRTLGDEERMRQLEAALGEREDDGFESQPASESVELYSDVASSPRPAERTSNKKNKSNNKKKKNRSPGSDFGDLPTLPMPNMNMFRSMSGDGMPLPPPPPLVSFSERSDAEEQAISDMLLSWYMTGYYTGLYQGMKKQRQGQSRRYH